MAKDWRTTICTRWRQLVVAMLAIISLGAAQYNKQEKDNWEKVRQIFNAYFASPSAENAEKVLLVLPDRKDVKDFENVNKTMDILYQEHIHDLHNLAIKGDRLTLRIAFKAVPLMDGFYSEQMDSLIGSSIRAAPATFLEEAFPVVKEESKRLAGFYPPLNMEVITWLLGGILAGGIFREDEEFKPDVFEKKIRLRMEALAKVKRQDLLELRDICLKILKEELKKMKSDAWTREMYPHTFAHARPLVFTHW
jgi:hypothetical protein